ncbi:ABC transporter permease [Limobrevibacterium gyesilva]|uniref:ABC transporter permease n=1 Tax=Limobrevibacterium gyesilva TaxID=2991712 RepID=A0AA41YP30_9PROT|nr:ABC transporter permease [Limobrevibacterium gyesilva]MCW3477099.1 ABC transporter permease [Limobrevibacterium gyesilva]
MTARFLLAPATDTQITHLGRLWLYAFAALALVFLVAPTLLIIPMSFTGAGFLEFPPRSWSLRWYIAYLDSPEWRDATLVSLRAATLTMLLATPLGVAAAYGVLVVERRTARAIGAAISVPMMMPAVLIGIGLYLLYVPLGLNNTLAGLVLGHVALTLPYVTLLVLARMKSHDPRQELAAQSLGCTRLRAFLLVTLPQIRYAVIAAALLAFIFSFDEGVVSYFIATGTGATLPRRMFLSLQFGVDPTIAAISSLLMVLTILLVAAIQIIQSRGGPRRKA